MLEPLRMGWSINLYSQIQKRFAGCGLLLLFGLTGFFQCVTAPAAAEDRKPTVLVVTVGKTDEARARETRFVTNLRLNIEGFAIRETLPASVDFNELSLNRQIELLKPVMERDDAAAAMWLSESAGDRLLLQVVVLDTGRALVRLFEEDLGGGSEQSLALTAGELLGTAYMFEPKAAKKRPQIEQLVEKTRIKAQVPPAARPSGLWKLVLLGHGALGVVGGAGPNVYAGGSIGGERGFVDRWFLGLGMGAAAGPLGDGKGFSLSGYEIAAELTGYLGMPIGKVRIGPFLQVRAGSTGIFVSTVGYDREDYAFLCLYGRLGLDLRITFSPVVTLKIAAGVEASPIQNEIHRESNDQIIQQNSLLRVWGGLGLVLF